MYLTMRQLFIIILFVGQLVPAVVVAEVWTISAEDWARPRTGYSLSQMQALQSCVNSMNKHVDSTLIIQYPGGEEGILWVSELKGWLVSLGVPSKKIQLRPGQSSDEKITLTLQ